MRSVPRKVPPPSSAAFNGSNGHNHRGANNNNLGGGRGATAVLPLQAYLVGISCAIVFMACIFFVADVSSSSYDDDDEDGDGSPRRRRRGRGVARRRDGKSPRRMGITPSVIGHPPPTTTGGGGGGTSEEVLDDRHYWRPSARVAAKSISNDGARHRLRRPTTGGILRRRAIATARAAPQRRKSDMMADNSRDDNDDDADANIHGDAQPPQSQCSIPSDTSLGSGRPSFEGSSAGVVCRVIDHHPIARNRHRYNQRRGTALHPGRDSAPDAHVVSAGGDDDVWSSASLISVPNETSYELFKQMNSQPLHRISNSDPMNASDEITKSIACPLDTVDRTMDTDDSNQHAASTSKHFVDDEKENVVKRLGSNDVKLKINRAITAGKSSSRITIGKVESAPANVASPRDYSIAVAIQSHVGNDDPDRHTDGEGMHSAGNLAHLAKNAIERDSWNSMTNGVDWAPSNAESIPRENCFPLQESARDSLPPKTHTASQGAESNADMSSLAPAPAARLTVLISNGVFDYYQKSHQKAALSLLGDLRIPYDVVDGNDPSQRERRDAFFGISDIRGNYPQIFLTSEAGDEHRFLGGYDWLDNVDFNYLKGIAIVDRNSSDKDETEHDPVDAKATRSQTNIKNQA